VVDRPPFLLVVPRRRYPQVNGNPHFPPLFPPFPHAQRDLTPAPPFLLPFSSQGEVAVVITCPLPTGRPRSCFPPLTRAQASFVQTHQRFPTSSGTPSFSFFCRRSRQGPSSGGGRPPFFFLFSLLTSLKLINPFFSTAEGVLLFSGLRMRFNGGLPKPEFCRQLSLFPSFPEGIPALVRFFLFCHVSEIIVPSPPSPPLFLPSS